MKYSAFGKTKNFAIKNHGAFTLHLADYILHCVEGRNYSKIED